VCGELSRPGNAEQSTYLLPQPSRAQVAGNSPVSSTLTVSTRAATAAATPERMLDKYRLALTASLFLGVLLRRQWRRSLLFTLLRLLALGGTLSCSGGNSGSSSSTTPPSTSGTTTGTYQVAVTATSGTVTISTTIPLSLQSVCPTNRVVTMLRTSGSRKEEPRGVFPQSWHGHSYYLN
jgi:hypothetical protein